MIIGINCAVADKSSHNKAKSRRDRQAFRRLSGFMPDYSSMENESVSATAGSDSRLTVLKHHRQSQRIDHSGRIGRQGLQ